MGSTRNAAAVVVACAGLLAGCGGPKVAPLVNCTEGEACTPANSCHQGKVSCATGTAVCADAQASVVDGTGCGSGHICLSGLCGAPCTPNQACTTANPCKLAMTTCATATSEPACTEAGDLADGTGCGDGVVCRAGACVASCQGGQACQPPNACTLGVSSCPSTASDPVCILTANKEDGTSCGDGQVCSAGSCVGLTCQAGAACQPADPCKDGVVTCTSPLSPGACAVTTTRDDGASCGTGLACAAGKCIGPPTIEYLAAWPSNVAPGSPANLRWTITGASLVTLDPGGATLDDGGATVSPAQTTVYTLTAANPAGSTHASVTVTVSTIQKLWVYCGPDHVDSSVPVGGAIRFSSVFQVGSGDPGRDITWSVESGGGAVFQEPGGTAAFQAPATPGKYRVTGVSSWDPARQDQCWITVIGGQGSFNATGSLPFPVKRQTATLLNDGRVLVAGGWAASFPNAEATLYDPAARSFSRTERMAAERGGGAATLLRDGTVLLTGGFRESGNTFYADPIIAELYDPAAERFTTTGAMAVNRIGHTATLLPDGQVLVAGATQDGAAPSAELYDPASGLFSAAGELIVNRSGHAATLLPSGLVLITGGRSQCPTCVPEIYPTTAEVYDPSSNAFSGVGALHHPRSGHTATLLRDGRVLIAGGGSREAELFHPDTGEFTDTGAMSEDRSGHTATLLPSGLVLLAGCGEFVDNKYTPSAELFDPVTGTFSPAGAMAEGRCVHTATLLHDGTVLLAGGVHRDHDDGGLYSAEIYSP
jgi:hypothetical protein